MKGDINRDFYCSARYYGEANHYACRDNKGGVCSICANYHRKWPTPKQFKEEYGEDYPNDWYVCSRLDVDGRDWNIDFLSAVKKVQKSIKLFVICLCTPWGRPPDDWNPENILEDNCDSD